MSSSIVVGEIDRISASGNGMLRTNGEEYNLGPVDTSHVGNTVVAVPLIGTLAVCLTAHDDPERYLSLFYSNTDITEEKAKQSVVDTEDLQMAPVRDFLAGNVSPTADTDFNIGDTISAEVTIGSSNGSYVIFSDGTVIEVTDKYLPAGEKVTLEIVEAAGPIWKARLDPTVLERAPEPGTELTVTILKKIGSTGYATYDGAQIMLPRCSATKGDSLRVIVTRHLKSVVIAKVDALPAEARPSVGDILMCDVALPADGSSTVLIHDGIPIEITQTAFPIEGTFSIEILDFRANGATGRVNLTANSNLSEGVQLSLEEITDHDGQLVSRVDGIPIIVPLDDPIPSVPSSLSVTVTDIESATAYASIRHNPKIQQLQERNCVTVTTTGRTDQYLIAEYEDHPVWVSWPFEETEYPRMLTVEVSRITDAGLFASPLSPSDTDILQRDGIFPARIEAVHSDHISASIVAHAGDESYVFPVIVPISFDISGEIGVEIVDREQPHFVGIVRALDTGENATPVPVYLQKLQEALLAIRKERFETAVESARGAADATKTAARQAEALRFQTFASGEAILMSEGSTEEALDEVVGASKKVSSLNLSDTYQGLIDIELEIYEELVSVGADRAPESVEGLQRIAYNVDTRERLDAIASRIQKDLLETSTDVKIDGWAPNFPHPLLVFRVAQACMQFKSPPENASKLVDQYPSIERLQWRVPPESNPEPTPDETVSVVQETLERTSTTIELGENDRAEAVEDGFSDSDHSATTGVEASDEPLADQSREITAEDNDTSGEPPQSEGLADFDTDTSTSTETPDSIQEPDEDGKNTESNPTDTPNLVEAEEAAPNFTTNDSESTSSTTQSVASDRLKRLRADAEAAASDDPIRDTSSTGSGSRYQRAPAIKKYVQARADGVCEACGEPAPFETPEGRPYLETHHIDELGQGGEDHPDKVVAVCPTCHKRIHYGADGDVLNETLRQRLKDELASVGVE